MRITETQIKKNKNDNVIKKSKAFKTFEILKVLVILNISSISKFKKNSETLTLIQKLKKI